MALFHGTAIELYRPVSMANTLNIGGVASTPQIANFGTSSIVFSKNLTAPNIYTKTEIDNLLSQSSINYIYRYVNTATSEKYNYIETAGESGVVGAAFVSTNVSNQNKSLVSLYNSATISNFVKTKLLSELEVYYNDVSAGLSPIVKFLNDGVTFSKNVTIPNIYTKTETYTKSEIATELLNNCIHRYVLNDTTTTIQWCRVGTITLPLNGKSISVEVSSCNGYDIGSASKKWLMRCEIMSSNGTNSKTAIGGNMDMDIECYLISNSGIGPQEVRLYQIWKQVVNGVNTVQCDLYFRFNPWNGQSTVSCNAPEFQFYGIYNANGPSNVPYISARINNIYHTNNPQPITYPTLNSNTYIITSSNSARYVLLGTINVGSNSKSITFYINMSYQSSKAVNANDDYYIINFKSTGGSFPQLATAPASTAFYGTCVGYKFNRYGRYISNVLEFRIAQEYNGPKGSGYSYYFYMLLNNDAGSPVVTIDADNFIYDGGTSASYTGPSTYLLATINTVYHSGNFSVPSTSIIQSIDNPIYTSKNGFNFPLVCTAGINLYLRMKESTKMEYNMDTFH